MHFDTSFCKEQVGTVTRGTGAELHGDNQKRAKKPPCPSHPSPPCMSSSLKQEDLDVADKKNTAIEVNKTIK